MRLHRMVAPEQPPHELARHEPPRFAEVSGRSSRASSRATRQELLGRDHPAHEPARERLLGREHAPV